MRIGLFTDAYLPDINGVVSSVATLKEALEKQGHVVYVISNHHSSSVVLKDHILRLPGIELKRFYGYKMSSPFQFVGKDYVTKMDLDIIHMQTEAGIGFFARHVAKVLKVPLVYTYHTMYEDYTHYVNPLDFGALDTVEKKAIRSLSCMIANRTQAVIAPSQKTKNRLLEYGVHTPIFVVPTGLDLSLFDRKSLDEKKIKEIRSSLNLNEDDHVVVYVGRIAKEKMISIPIKAVACSEDPHLHLVIVGGGTDEDYYHRLVKEYQVEDRVHFLGRKPKEDIAYYYAAFDCFVSGSLSETQGMTYIEALATGLPVFGRRDEVLEDLIDEGKSGYYFDDEIELAEKFKQYFSIDRTEREKFIQYCVDKAAPYTTEEFAKNVLNVYYYAIRQQNIAYTIRNISLKQDYVELSIGREGAFKKLLLPLEDFYEMELSVGQTIDAYLVDEYMAVQHLFIGMQKAKRRAMANDYTILEMRNYCKTKLETNDMETDAIIEALLDAGLLDDYQYAMEKANYWFYSGYGIPKIQKKLRLVGIDEAYIEQACNALDKEQELHNAAEAARMIAPTLTDRSINNARWELTQKLIAKGFSSDVAREASDQFEFEIDSNTAVQNAINKAKRLYKSMEEPRRTEKIKVYCLRKGFSISEIMDALESEGIND